MKVVCIGSGNVATHFALALKKSNAEILQVYSQHQEHAQVLADEVDAMAIDDTALISPDADLYLIAIKDDAIASVSSILKNIKGLVVHTSGATPMSVLEGMSRYGVLYPLQTFSRSRALDFSNVPLCVEAGDGDMLKEVKAVAELLSPLVYDVDSVQRKVLHLSAVFVCNFVNHMYAIGADILSAAGLDFELLKPLIMETAAKVQHAEPSSVQTGPAIRGDEQTMNRHKELLMDRPELAAIYETLSNSIKKTH
ncbi:hypothetical protein PBAL39_21540 [Pedobacter sp. BAL39]|uniref:Rossmann-like and DUF2520 domain-containing protein n=1 Tax=Pedobacter sp. BAL39 TaxID=391596 RepID=UPI0001559D7B|nr:DUF2520 domain-containing protein [Pedobacter sp. BAL39]EDM38699.1 hypothetical protein PBAL39_21540 [Pedobacter sp. BAL39]